MDGPSTRPGADVAFAQHAAVFGALFALALLLQVATGSFESGFGGFEDEPSHLVSALMIRDWLGSGAWLEGPSGALAYAREYHVHYPKVGIGQWPPFFHGVLASWMLVLGTSTASVVTFLTLVTSSVAFLIYAVLRRPIGTIGGAVAGVVYLSVPIVTQCSASAMTEPMIALLALGAVLAFGRFMDTGRARYALLFGALAACTILTKGSGLALSFVPLLSMAVGRRWDLLKRPSLWLAALVAGSAGPWYVQMLETNVGSWSGGSSPSFAYVRFAAGHFASWIPDLLGWLGLLLVPFGLAWSYRRGALQGRWHALIAWVPSLALLHLVVPSSVEERHLAVLAPAWTIFASLGAGVVARRIARAAGAGSGVGLAPALGVACVLLASIAGREGVRTKDWTGWGTAARDLVARGAGSPQRYLIASDPVGEGLFVAGVAFADDERPNRTVLRASKVLGTAGWSGRDYEGRFRDTAQLDRFLAESGVAVVLVDESVRGGRHWYGHMDQLLALMGEDGTRWRRLTSWDVVRGGAPRPQTLTGFVRTDWRDLPLPDLRFEDVHR